MIFPLAILVLGASGIISQIVLLREFIITFFGNELSIGIILANWVILEAVGSFLIGSFIDRIESRIKLFVLLTTVFSIGFPGSIFLIRVLKTLTSQTPGEGMGLFSILYLSLLILIPISLVHGGLFTLAVRIYSDIKKTGSGAVGRVYFLETIGTIAGGVILTFLLIPLLSSLTIGLALAMLNFVALSIFLAKRRMSLITLVCAVLTALLLFSPFSRRIEELSIKQRFFDQDVVFYEDSFYGNVAVTRMAEQKTYFSNGVPVFTTPYPDISFVEEYVHLPLLFKDKVDDILIISGGYGGIISELLKYDPERIDYVELDPLLIKAIRHFPDSLTKRELASEKVSVINADGRLFVKKSSKQYDLIMLGPSMPADLQINRLFTREFFEIVFSRLKSGGILLLHLPGSMTYLSRELKMINGSIVKTLGEVFDRIFVIPGDYNIIISGRGSLVLSSGFEELIARFHTRGLDVKLLSEGHIRYRLGQYWQDWFWNELKGVDADFNQDFEPKAMLYTLEYWSAAHGAVIERWLRSAEGLGDSILYGVGIIVVGLILLCLRFPLVKKNGSLSLTIFATGLSGMIFQLVLIFGFQILYGYVYYMVGLLITALMGGIAIGSALATRLVEKKEAGFNHLLLADIGVFAFSLLMIGVIRFLKDYSLPHLYSPVLFIILSILSGLLIGFQFPVACHIFLGEEEKLGKTTGSLYAADLIGGWLGGIFGAIVLLPVLGLIQTLVIVATIKIFTIVLIYHNK
ncbi:MAG TPA: hypothetical protein EYP58_01860 [bacterium (Candidatus Stahlbacteria)]|nr:hypothetical protein [Candidatus Stahlbacteria bacterium]